MASLTVIRPDVFPAGTTVSAYALTGRGEIPASGVPSGSVAASGTVAADGSLTLTGLASDTPYVLYAASPDRYLRAGAWTPKAGLLEAKRSLYTPTGVLDETMPRYSASAAISVLSGTLKLAGFVLLRPGVAYSSISCDGVAAAVTPTNQWFCLVRVSDLAVLAKTVDDGATAWAANAPKALAISGAPLTVAAETPAYVGVLQAAATPATVAGIFLNFATVNRPIIMGGNSTTGLTNPASLGATAAAITATSGVAYGTIS